MWTPNRTSQSKTGLLPGDRWRSARTSNGRDPSIITQQLSRTFHRLLPAATWAAESVRLPRFVSGESSASRTRRVINIAEADPVSHASVGLAQLLEPLLLTHPNVADAAVMPVAADEAGERPKAFVVTLESLSVEEVMTRDCVVGAIF